MSRLGSGELESRVLEVLWRVEGALTPREVHGQLPADRELAYTTVMTILVRLWRKDLVTRSRRGRAYAYEAAVSPQQRTALRMGELLESANDPSLALNQFVAGLSEQRRAQLRRALRGGRT